jgi:Tripartite tricarboxylate transporter family receptor
MIWVWIGFIAFVLLMLALDLGVFHRRAHVVSIKEAIAWSLVWVAMGLAFAVFVYFAYESQWFGLGAVADSVDGLRNDGSTATEKYLTGYVVEKSLSVDNIFVIAMKEKIKWVHVPYKGTAPAETAAMGGHVDAVSAGDMHNALNGQLRPLLMHTKDPYDKLPGVPTTMQLGYNCYNDTLLAVYGPAGMDPAVAKRLGDALEKAQGTPAWKQWIDQFGCVSLKMRSAEYTKFLEEAWDREIEIQKALGLITEPATAPR